MAAGSVTSIANANIANASAAVWADFQHAFIVPAAPLATRLTRTDSADAMAIILEKPCRARLSFH